MLFASTRSNPRSFRVSCLHQPVRTRVARPAGRGKSFAQKRIEHSLEMAGACIMMALFLAMALFV